MVLDGNNIVQLLTSERVQHQVAGNGQGSTTSAARANCPVAHSGYPRLPLPTTDITSHKCWGINYGFDCRCRYCLKFRGMNLVLLTW
eukprot:4148904-Amphidinium_carterae.1